MNETPNFLFWEVRLACLRAITSVDVKLCKIVQNGKKCSFYTIWAKKPPTSARANLCINASCYSTRANMHSIVACAYNILIVFSLSVYWLSPPSLSHFIRDAPTLSFFHLISLAYSSFRQSPRSKLSPSPTRSSKPSRRTNLSPTTRMKFSFFQEAASFFGLSSVPIHFSLRFAGVGRISHSCSPESAIFGSFSEPHYFVPFELLAVFCCDSVWIFFFFFGWVREREIDLDFGLEFGSGLVRKRIS